VVLEGEDTELDKSTVDVLAEPLLHLVRNAVDHGIATPEERERLGKPPVGTITLRARQRGDTVEIEVEDDGAGLDLERILARARASGLVGADERPDHAEITDLIFRPGFSTRSEADEVSGRGIGMDVVATTVARLRGQMTVRAEPGEGTRFVMELPLTLAVLPVLLFEAAGEMMALPTADVEETRRVYAVRRVAGAEVIAHDDMQIPLARPAALFGWDAGGEGPPSPPPYAVVVRRGARVVAVAADRLIEQREVVVKALPRFLGPLRGVSGASIAPDGRVVLLLDAGNVITLNLDSHRRSERASISR
jgi:two-component system, chemotaxis family, sensor kinase CheA